MSPSRVAGERSARYARWAASSFERGELPIASRDQRAQLLRGRKIMIGERS